MKKYYVFDNGGETLDRYTIIDENGDMLALSETGAGVDMFAGNCVDNYMFATFGYSWRKQCDVKKVIKNKLPELIEEFKGSDLGQLIEFNSLSKEMQEHINKRFSEQ